MNREFAKIDENDELLLIAKAAQCQILTNRIKDDKCSSWLDLHT